MLTAIALTPSAPVLVPELAGAAAAEVEQLCDAALTAAATLPDRWIIIGVMRDITRRLEMTRSTAKLQRMYSALTETNAAMLRAQSRVELFATECEAVVKGGRFSVAAILTPDGESMRPAAVAVSS